MLSGWSGGLAQGSSVGSRRLAHPERRRAVVHWHLAVTPRHRRQQGGPDSVMTLARPRVVIPRLEQLDRAIVSGGDAIGDLGHRLVPRQHRLTKVEWIGLERFARPVAQGGCRAER